MKIPWRRKWQPTPVFLPGESHGQRSLTTTIHGIPRVGQDLATKPPPPAPIPLQPLTHFVGLFSVPWLPHLWTQWWNPPMNPVMLHIFSDSLLSQPQRQGVTERSSVLSDNPSRMKRRTIQEYCSFLGKKPSSSGKWQHLDLPLRSSLCFLLPVQGTAREILL